MTELDARLCQALAGSDGKWSIVVYCDSPAHEKHYEIAEFRITVSAPEWPSYWMYHRRGRRQRRRGESVVTINAQHMVGDRLMTKPYEHGTSVSDAELRYPLKCACGDSMPWRRSRVRADDRLQIALDGLAVAGVSRIALAALRRIVTTV